MNRQEFTQTNSYPLSTQTMSLLQDSITAVAELSRIGGENYILSGCVQTGNSVTSGTIVIKGEPMPFEGGTAISTITIIETEETVLANGISYPKARIKRYAKFASGTGTTYLPWANFKHLPTNQQLEASKAAITYVDEEIKKIAAYNVPQGAIVMWSGSVTKLPAGWVLCNGLNGSPNLTGKFIVGYSPNDSDYNGIGKMGGAAMTTLSPEQMPAHKHIGSLQTWDQDRVFNHFGCRKIIEGGVEMVRGKWEFPMYQGYTSTEGGSKEHENRPPYYVLAYIMKL